MGLTNTLKHDLSTEWLIYHKAFPVSPTFAQHAQQRRTDSDIGHKELLTIEAALGTGQRSNFSIWHRLFHWFTADTHLTPSLDALLPKRKRSNVPPACRSRIE